MLSVTNLPNLKELYDTTIEFFALRSPTASAFRGTSLPRDTRSRSGSNPPPSPALVDRLTPVLDPIGLLTRECAALREKLDYASLDTSENPVATASRHSVHSMRPEYDALKHDLSRSQSEIAHLEERCRALEKNLKDARDLIRARDAEIAALKHSSQEAAAASTRVPTKRPSSRASSACKHDESFSSEAEAVQRSTEVFMTRIDVWSGAQILQAVHDLNSEILQFAASATELCTFEHPSASSSHVTASAIRDTSSRLGATLCRILSTQNHSQDPILVQLAVQGCVATCAIRALSSFCIGFPRKADAVLSQLYSHIYVAEPQPTSSKWRSLTHRYIHSMYPTLTDYSVNELSETIIRWTCDIFAIAGSTSSDVVSTRDGLRSRFGEQIRRISRGVERLEVVMKEETMSTNFDIVSAGYGDTFNPRTMTDVFGEYGTSRGQILATTELGLKCTTRKSAVNDTGSIEQRLLLQPKVILESALDVLDPK
ncbi:hypothetical protein FISHEDRAFT_44373 [Fistulina hepatica ATCC 64428]|uniref:Uncharacterized protein n=1 Tax=Fistulina hepatica ATCC 64428 TaxID=1128425 RepID=A0A0D7AB79_9AGAR|nr:hypothetical protein FISHEDRAFT_44373 [Fistulina hepatica ATCC 64428]